MRKVPRVVAPLYGLLWNGGDGCGQRLVKLGVTMETRSSGELEAARRGKSFA